MKLLVVLLCTQVFLFSTSFAASENKLYISPGTLFEVVGVKGTRACPHFYPDPNCPIDGYQVSETQNALDKAYQQCSPINNKAVRVSDWTILSPDQVSAEFVCVPLQRPGSVVQGGGVIYTYTKLGCNGIDQTGKAITAATINAELACGYPDDKNHIKQISDWTAQNETINDGQYGWTCIGTAYANFECQ